jgi:hypothetical protein
MTDLEAGVRRSNDTMICRRMGQTPNEDIVKAASEQLCAKLDVYEKLLANQPYLTGPVRTPSGTPIDKAAHLPLERLSSRSLAYPLRYSSLPRWCWRSHRLAPECCQVVQEPCRERVVERH